MTNIVSKDSIGKLNEEDMLKSPEEFIDLLNYNCKNTQNISNKSKNLDFNDDDNIQVDFNIDSFDNDDLNAQSEQTENSKISLSKSEDVPKKQLDSIGKIDNSEMFGRKDKGQGVNKDQQNLQYRTEKQNLKTVKSHELKQLETTATIKHGIMYRRSRNK